MISRTIWMLVRVFIVVLLSFDFFDDCPSNSKTGHEQRRPADSPLRLIVVNLLQHVRTFAAYGLSSPIMWLWYSDMGFLRHRKRMSKSGLCIIFTYWFIIQVKDERKMQNGPYAINDITDSWIIVPLGPAEIIHTEETGLNDSGNWEKDRKVQCDYKSEQHRNTNLSTNSCKSHLPWVSICSLTVQLSHKRDRSWD